MAFRGPESDLTKRLLYKVKVKVKGKGREKLHMANECRKFISPKKESHLPTKGNISGTYFC
jgi:hypothetical protein